METFKGQGSEVLVDFAIDNEDGGSGGRDMDVTDQGLGDSTQVIRKRIEEESARQDSEEVPHSQPEVEGTMQDDIVLTNARTGLIHDKSMLVAASGKDAAIVEHRRRTSRKGGDQNIMDKAKDRAKVKNLEVPESKRLPASSYRVATVITSSC